MDKLTTEAMSERVHHIQNHLDKVIGGLRSRDLGKVVKYLRLLEDNCAGAMLDLSKMETRLQNERKRAEELLKAHGFKFSRLDLVNLEAPYPRPGEEGEKDQ